MKQGLMLVEYEWPGSANSLCRTTKLSTVIGDPVRDLNYMQMNYPFQMTLRGYWPAFDHGKAFQDLFGLESAEDVADSAIGQLMVRYNAYAARGSFLLLPEALIQEMAEFLTLDDLLGYEEVTNVIEQELYR